MKNALVFVLIIMFVTQLSAKQKVMADSVISRDRFNYPQLLKYINTEKDSLLLPFSMKRNSAVNINDFTYVDPLSVIRINDSYAFLPSWLYRIPVSDIDSLSEEGRMAIRTIRNLPIKKLVQPFYILNHEVTNVEYREFVYWVRDSIARRILSLKHPEFIIQLKDEEGHLLPVEECPLNWKTQLEYYKQPFVDELVDMYMPDNERYYRRKEFDIRKLMYEYTIDFDEKIKDKDSIGNMMTTWQRYVLNIYPDTLAWVNLAGKLKYFIDNVAIFDPIKNMYFWHPAFDEMPVVGLSYDQIKAFCNWKTKMIIKKFPLLKKVNFEIDLPTDYEWETTELMIAKVDGGVYSLFNQSWYEYFIFLNGNDLVIDEYEEQIGQLTEPDKKETSVLDGIRDGVFIKPKKKTVYNKYMNNPFIDEECMNYYMSIYNYALLPTILKADFSSKQNKKYKEKFILEYLSIHTSSLGISCLKGNYSEWVNATYDSLYSVLLQKRLEYLFPTKNPDQYDMIQLMRPVGIKKGDYMIKGANIFDIRNRMLNSQTPTTFSSPYSAYSTVSFRYIIRLAQP